MAGGTVWGIDIGKNALKAIRLRALGNDLVEVVGQTYVEHDTILTDTGGERDIRIAQALEKFLSQNDISSDQVVVSVPGHHTLARFSPLPPVDPKKIPDLVRYEADQQIPFDMDEVIWDYQTFQEEGAPEIQVGIFAMKRELVRDYLGHFDAAGIEPVIVQSAPLALYSAALFDGLIGDGTTVLINIGTANTDLVLAGRNVLWTRSIPIGGNNFTEALVKAFKLSFAKAENLKRQAATSKYARRIFQAMRPVFADLVQELQRSIGRYTSAHRDTTLSKVIGVGNAFSLPVLQKYIQQNLQLTVEQPSTFEKMQLAAAVDNEEFRSRLPNYAVAYGLALQGLGLAKIDTNLLPPDVARQVVWQKKRPFFGAAAACLLLAAGAIWLRYSWDVGSLARTADTVPPKTVPEAANWLGQPRGSESPGQWARKILAASDFLKQELDKVSQGGGTERQKIEQLHDLLRKKAVLPRILAIVHEALPKPKGTPTGAITPEAYKEAVSKTPRTDREEIFITRFVSTYVPDLAGPEASGTFNDKSGDPDKKLIPAAEGTPRPGFVCELECRTPNRQHSQFINSRFQKVLRDLGRLPKKGFYVNHVALTSIARVAEVGVKGYEATAGGGAPPSSYYPGAPGGMFGGSPMSGMPPPPGMGGGGSTPKPAKKTVEAKVVDPLTDESMDSDWVFTIAFDVVLADLPEAQPGAAPEGVAAAANP